MITEKKYEFTGETIEVLGKVLHRIKAIRDFGVVKAGGGNLVGLLKKKKTFHTKALVGSMAMLGSLTMLMSMAVLESITKLMFVVVRSVVARSVVMLKLSEIQILLFSRTGGAADDFSLGLAANNMWQVGCFYGTGEELIKESLKRL